MTEQTRWAGACLRCGDPADYHGATFCTVKVGSGPEAQRRVCDCPGYMHPDRLAELAERGRCGAITPFSPVAEACALPSGHAGWHDNGNGCEWGT